MKKVLLFFVVFGVFTAHAQERVSVATETTTSASPSTRAAPTATSFTTTSGSVIGNSIFLVNATGIRVSVCAVGGTLSGAGSLNAYLLDDRDGLVKRNVSLDLAITVTATSCAGAACTCQVFADQRVSASAAGGYVLYAPNGVTHSGTGVTVRIIGTAGRP